MSRSTPVIALVDESQLDDVVRALLMGLTTDGAHHKQFYLEEALKALVTDDYYKEAKRECGWSKGIPA
jgi:hypothetical protein